MVPSPVPLFLTDRSYINYEADLILIAGTDMKELPVHQMALFCASPFFEKLITYDGKKYTTGNLQVVTFPDISFPIMKEIVNYCYTGKINVSGANVEELLIAADYMAIENIVDACEDFKAKKEQEMVSFELSNVENALQRLTTEDGERG